MNTLRQIQIGNFRKDYMARFWPVTRSVWFLLVLVAAMLVAPRDAHALLISGIFSATTSAAYYRQCQKDHPSAFYVTCRSESWFHDPLAQSVTGLSLTIEYDPLIRTFDPANSGPLGVFSIGGDAPPADPGIGTELLRLLPSSGFAPGAPLPGSTLTYTDVNGILTVNYDLASPITADSEINFFRLDFILVNPSQIDPALSTVTYETVGLGGDFSTLSFTCKTLDDTDRCGSNHPSSGITLNIFTVPEPSTLPLLGLGLALGLIVRARRRAFDADLLTLLKRPNRSRKNN